MENQYFVPKLDELFVGYELEYQGNIFHKLSKSTEWKKAKVGVTQEGDVVLPITRIASMLKKGWIRTPYLTEEILEKEGWKRRKTDKTYLNTNFEKNYKTLNRFLDHPEELCSISNNIGTYFVGVIKSVNELRKVEQFLKI